MNPIKKQAERSVFTVKEKISLSPHYTRIVCHMSDEQVLLFSRARAGANNKIYLPPPGITTVIFPGEPVPEGLLPAVQRTYTTRRIDPDRQELWVDFVAHGDTGPASYWAHRAGPGSQLGLAMKIPGRPLFPEATNYLFVGDATALPVIATMLEQVAPTAQVTTLIEVPGKADELPLHTSASLQALWFHNEQLGPGSLLADAVPEITLPADTFVFVAAEYHTAKRLRHYFKEELSWPTANYSIVSYWKQGESEDQSEMQRRETTPVKPANQ
ncbi:siderophore-interacting protein [Taibaiella chishuiensis]|uniref:NADPH-dependent ferric siderophore reductase n=1 Tax=Taibaiella chishuiensis TaxID=1434707 RepID=A0A2P8D1U5_9BACT|nr:siderophore-interacting protein [Taibaiella chishuiensis]PSK91188.1 NADPH-dependent ferric siderophore reductase [Taibaiella chishuiensis]